MSQRFTYREIRGRRLRLVAIVLVVAALIAGLYFAWGTITQSMREQGAYSVRNSILEAARQCCAIEGSYPPSLEYLEENYGLVVNHADYIITYDVFAENIAPTVVAVPR